MTKYTVKVTDLHIRFSQPGNNYENPVAMAVSEVIRYSGFGAPFAWAGTGDILLHELPIRRGGHCVSIPLPPEALTFLQRYDKGEPVHPFEFELEVPSSA